MAQPARKPRFEPDPAEAPLRCSVCGLWWWQGDDCQNKRDCNWTKETGDGRKDG